MSVSDEVKEVKDPMAEVTAMQALVAALKGLDTESIGRVLRWAADTYSVSVNVGGGAGNRGGGGRPGSGAGSGSSDSGNGNGSMANGATQFSDLAELFAATSPESDADRVLVAGYWAQFGEGRPEINSQEINSALKNLGHPIKNITSAFDTLKARKPAPVMQLKKSGTSKQARKTYKRTVAGKNNVELMITPQ
jgi:hypothetical protein